MRLSFSRRTILKHIILSPLILSILSCERKKDKNQKSYLDEEEKQFINYCKDNISELLTLFAALLAVTRYKQYAAIIELINAILALLTPNAQADTPSDQGNQYDAMPHYNFDPQPIINALFDRDYDTAMLLLKQSDYTRLRKYNKDVSQIYDQIYFKILFLKYQSIYVNGKNQQIDVEIQGMSSSLSTELKALLNMEIILNSSGFNQDTLLRQFRNNYMIARNSGSNFGGIYLQMLEAAGMLYFNYSFIDDCTLTPTQALTKANNSVLALHGYLKNNRELSLLLSDYLKLNKLTFEIFTYRTTKDKRDTSLIRDDLASINSSLLPSQKRTYYMCCLYYFVWDSVKTKLLADELRYSEYAYYTNILAYAVDYPKGIEYEDQREQIEKMLDEMRNYSTPMYCRFHRFNTEFFAETKIPVIGCD